MSNNPIIRFGMVATSTALKAKSGALGVRDRLTLARSAFRHSEEIPFCCSEVEFFLATVEGNPSAAAERLQCFVSALVPAPKPNQPEFDWQARADLQ